jgi:hypothetical protein
VGCQAHNLKVEGSNPSPATNFNPAEEQVLLSYKDLYNGRLPKLILFPEALFPGVFG